MLTADAQGDFGMFTITVFQSEGRMVQFVATHMLSGDRRIATITIRKSEPHHVARSKGAHRSHVLIVRIQHGKTPGNEAMNDFRLGLHDASRRAEFAQMRDADFQHNRDVRRHQRRQISDFPNMVGAHFRYQKTSFGIYFERSQGQADFVIERSDRRNCRSHMRQQRLHKILGGGLADGTGDADHRKRSP